MSELPPKIRDLEVTLTPIALLKPSLSSARTHSKKQIGQIAKSIETFGWTNPILTDEDNRVMAGQARLEAAKQLGLLEVPTIRLTDMSEAQKRAYVIADNKLAEQAGWDRAVLAVEFKSIIEIDADFDLTDIGFETGEIDVLLAEPMALEEGDEEDHEPEIDPERPLITKRGDLWQLGVHRLGCGDALNRDDLVQLMGDEQATMVFTDVPYNIPIRGFVSGLGSANHDEFAMASGEMTAAEFTDFLRKVMANLVEATVPGSIHFHCIDWRHIYDMLTAGRETYSEVKNICVWAKTNAGMGSLYRSQHELVVVFKNGTAPHINNVELGRHGRSRSNVWTYAGVNTFGAERANLAIHPTVKPVAMIEDAIMDCSNRGDAILDAFCGSGSTLIAAERAGRRGFGLEIEPKYVDAALRRFRGLYGIEPVRTSDGRTLKQLE
ncbi:MAG: DNA methylase N-4 [Alphaproteobacteria bacterium 32-64-14]|nr:MAG: DNA methylase N-4 [Alphaproteobacteria bacterium 32-64-14]